jgi:alpha-methylacyl-CoA racemase
MGPLHGVKIVEFVALGPAPMGAMILADLGADIISIQRRHTADNNLTPPLFDPKVDILRRNQKGMALNLKEPAGIRAALRLVEGADVLIEGFRPGTMEKLGLGPELCLSKNPRLIYSRMTGWGQTGPLANAAGHDINYLAISGALHAIGEQDAVSYGCTCRVD